MRLNGRLQRVEKKARAKIDKLRMTVRFEHEPPLPSEPGAIIVQLTWGDYEQG